MTKIKSSKILIVEDEIIVARGIAKSLAQFGYEVVGTVYSGEQAILLAEQYRPDLVMMDIVLKGKVDGIEAAAQIRSRFHIPVIFLTAYSDKDTLERAKVTEPYGYLLKPYHERDLHTCIETALFKHQQEIILQEKSNWLSNTLSSIGDAVIATDIEERIAYLNPEAQSLTGWSHNDAAGRPVQEVLNIFNSLTGDRVESPTTRALSEKTKVRLPENTFLVSRDNRKISIYDSGTPIKDQQGKTIGSVVIFQEVRTSPVKGEEVQADSDAPAKGGQALSEFTSIASHDLKEPLRKIQILSDRLQRNLGLSIDEKSKDYLDRLQKTTDHMEGLLNGLLEFSRLTSKPPQFVPVNLELLISEVILHLDTRLEETGGKVEINNLPTIEAVPTQMMQLFQNLILNSLKYRRQNVPPKITLDGKKVKEGLWQINLTDNGIGFEQNAADRIFMPFKRLHSKSAIEGHGLGLAICKKVIANHGGEISARSKPGQGSTFIITLPEKEK